MNRTKTLNSLWMIVAAFFFAVMGECVKFGAMKYASTELIFYRSLFGLIAIILFTLPRHMSFATPHIRLQLSRGINGFIAMMLFFYSIPHLPVSTAASLNYTAPIFLAIFFAFVLHEKVNRTQAAAILLGFIGVLLLLEPSLRWSFVIASSPGLVAGILTGFVYLQLIQLGRLNEPEWRTVFYFSLVATVGSGIWAVTQKFHPITLADIPLLAGMGLSATVGQLAMTRAYRKGDSLTVGNLVYCTILFACIFDIYLWEAHLSPLNWLAITLIVGSGLLSLWVTARSKDLMPTDPLPNP